MTGDLASLVPFAALVTFCYYVVARAEITRWFWEGWVQVSDGNPLSDDDAQGIGEAVNEIHRRFPMIAIDARLPRGPLPFRSFVNRLLSCPMCSGFWLGLACGWAFDLPTGHPLGSVGRFLWGGVYGLVLTPIVIGAMRWLQHMEHREAMSAANDARMESIIGNMPGMMVDMVRAFEQGMRPPAPDAHLKSVPPATVIPMTRPAGATMTPEQADESGVKPEPPKAG